MKTDLFVRSALLASAIAFAAPVIADAAPGGRPGRGGDHRPGRPGGGDHRPGRPGGGDYRPGRPPHRPPPYRPAPPHRPPPPPYRPAPPPYRPAPPPYYPPRPTPPPSYGTVLQQYIGQHFYGRTTLHLRQMLGIGSQYNGYRIESVTVRMRTNSGDGFAALVVNGYRSNEQRVFSSYPTDYMFFPDSYNDQIGYEVDSLQVDLGGDFYVESVSVRLR